VSILQNILELNKALDKTKKNVRKASASGAVPAAADMPVAAPGKKKKDI